MTQTAWPISKYHYYMSKKSCPIFIVYLQYTKETFWTHGNCFQKLNIKNNTWSMVLVLDGNLEKGGHVEAISVIWFV